MRNKVKRGGHAMRIPCRTKDRARAAEAITLVSSESSCSSPGTDSASLAPTCSDVASAAGASERNVQPLQERRKTCCAKDVQIAPIFWRTQRQSKSTRSSGGERLQKSVPPALSEDSRRVKSQHRSSASAISHPPEEEGFIVSVRREKLSPSSLRSCLGEVRTSNPAFPVRAVFSTLQNKAGGAAQDLGSAGANPATGGYEPLTLSPLSKPENSAYPSSPQNPLQEKRKRGDACSERPFKRPRGGLVAEGTVGVDRLSARGDQGSPVLPGRRQPRCNKLSRTHRLRQQRGGTAGSVSSSEPNSERTNDTESEGRSPVTHDVLHNESSFEDVLWTDKYSPQHSSEVIINSGSVNKLHSWLKKWKLRADCDERRKEEERKDEDNRSDSWDCGDFQGEAGAEDDREGPLCNAMLLTGPPGVGKTASVYACAQELGFKVFEVNCSSQRSGRHVLSQLKEATQSHLVEASGNGPLKPAYLSHYTTSSCTPKPEAAPGKPVPAKNVISASKRRAALNFARSRRRGKANAAAATLANYFKTKARADHLHFCGLSPSEEPGGEELREPSPGCDQSVARSKKAATSLILFEEVDVIFNDDVGFLAAVKAFMTTTKRPVILTTNDPSFRERFNCSLEEVVFKTPSAVDACSYLQLVCLAESVRLESADAGALFRLTCGDVRRCLLQLQLWARSGGARASQSRGLPEDSYAAERGENFDSGLPPRDTGCAASMLGLLPVTRNRLVNLLKQRSETDTNELLRLLAESWRGGVPLLYTNLELLLPFGAQGASAYCPGKATCPGPRSELAPSDADLQFQRVNGNVSPKESVTHCKYVRNISRLSRRKRVATVFDTKSSPALTHKPQSTSSSLKGAPSRLPSSSNRTEQLAAKASADCLDALTDFFDLMSFLDATLPSGAPLGSGSRMPEAFVWTGAEIKDGLLDETREEEEVGGGSWSQERLLDIQAAAEGLGGRRCWWRVREAWTGARKVWGREPEDEKRERLPEALASPVSSKRQSLRFSFQPLCAPSVSQRRYKLSRTVLSSKSFGPLGNRRAVCVDYMPVLRSVCRSHSAQQQKEEPVGRVNYLSSKHLGLSVSTLRLLAEDFS